MVLEHQTQMQNAFTFADFTVRRELHEHEESQGTATPGAEHQTPDDAKRELVFIVEQATKKVVDYMLFVGEARLTSEIKCSTTFTEEFTGRGPDDATGRSLRDFDLHSRMFRYPCSYLIYSPAFDALQPELRDAIYRQLWSVLAENIPSNQYAHLSVDTRRAILEILRSTKSGLPDFWNDAHSSGENRSPDP
jgi:hypothetical protein